MLLRSHFHLPWSSGAQGSLTPYTATSLFLFEFFYLLYLLYFFVFLIFLSWIPLGLSLRCPRGGRCLLRPAARTQVARCSIFLPLAV